MPAIQLEVRPSRERRVEVERVSLTVVGLWLHENQLTAHFSLLRDEARDLGHALVAEANRPFDHHQREEDDESD